MAPPASRVNETTGVAAEGAAKAEPKPDAGGMEKRGRQREAEAEGERAGRAEFAAMRMTVEESEKADHRHGGAGRHVERDGGQQADDDDRGEDDRLDEGQRQVKERCGKAERHRADEARRVRASVRGCSPVNARVRAARDAPCQQRGPQADRHHREDVI